MSTNLAYAAPLAAPGLEDDLLESPERHLGPIEIVTSRAQRRARPRIVYALIATAALFLLLMAQLGISIALSKGAYQVSALQSEQTTLTRTQQKYNEKLGVLASPQNLANNATALGMVRGQNPAYLDLSIGTVYGTPTAASKDAPVAGGNLIGNSLLTGIPVVTKDKKTSESTATSSSTTGAATPKTSGAPVASNPNQLAAPETR
jgi:hypothetical protein